MGERLIQQGASSVTLEIMLRDRTTGHGRVGLVAVDVNFYYARPRAAPVAFTVTDLAGVTVAWASGGFKELAPSTAPGLYRLDVPNGAFANPGVDHVIIGWKGTTVDDGMEIVNMTPFDPSTIDKTGFKLAADGILDKTGFKLAADGMNAISGYVP